MHACPLSMQYSLKSKYKAWEYGLYVPETTVFQAEKSVIVSNTIFKTVLETKCTDPLEIYCMFRLQHFGQLVTNLLWDDSHVLETKKHSFWSKWLSYLAEILTSQWQEKLQWKRKTLLAVELEY